MPDRIGIVIKCIPDPKAIFSSRRDFVELPLRSAFVSQYYVFLQGSSRSLRAGGCVHWGLESAQCPLS